MEIKISDCGSDYADFHTLCEFQGDFKQRTDADIENVKSKIIEYGFSFPMFVWEFNGKKYTLDGHGRLAALRSFEQEGYEIPLVPIVYIQAENMKQAIAILLLCNSRFGYITESSAGLFMGDINYEDLINSLNIDDITLVTDEEAAVTKGMDIYCPKCGQKHEETV